MSLFSKLTAYARAAAAQRGPELASLPLIPKSLWSDAPENREAFNHFLLWIDALKLSRVNRVLDVGANHGHFSLAASTLYPEGAGAAG